MHRSRYLLKRLFPALCICATLFSGLGIWHFGSAARRVVEARSWVSVPCRILSAEVRYQRQPWITIRYEYEYAGQRFESTRYRFLGGRSDVQRTIPEHHHTGSSTTCFVDPDAPAQAVMVGGFTWDMLFGLIPLFFFLLFSLVTYSIVRDWFGGPTQPNQGAASNRRPAGQSDTPGEFDSDSCSRPGVSGGGR
jgi:hypothetical protein